MGRTKKVGITGRFGVRYGATIRNRVIPIEKESKKSHSCPECLNKTLKRINTAIWECSKCGLKFAGKAYTPS